MSRRGRQAGTGRARLPMFAGRVVTGLPLIVVLLALSIMSCSRKPELPPGTVTITFWHSFVATTIPALEELLKDFERDNPGIHIKAQYVPTGDALVQKLVSAVESQTAPDVSWIHTDFLDKLVQSGAVYPIEEFQKGPDSLTAAEIADIFPPLLQAGTYRGVLYSLPMEATSLALLYNREMFRQAGLDPNHPPRDWQELKEYAAKLTVDKDGDGRTDQFGFFVPVFPASGELNIWMTLQWTPFLWQAGGTEFNAGMTQSLINSQAGVQALTLWKTIYDAEDFRRFALAHDMGFASGKLAMIMDGPWDLPRFRLLKDVDWAVAPLPAGPAARATYLAGEQLTVFRQTRHPAETWKFIKWMLRPEVQARFSERSGYLPVRKSVLQLPEYRKYLETDAPLKAYVDQMDVGRARQPIDRHRVEINRALAEAIEKATLGKQDPKVCLDEAAQTIDGLLR